MNQQRTEPIIPPELFDVTKEQFALIKCRHHLHRLSVVPPSLQQKAKELATVARPAFRSDYFTETAQSLADAWLEGTHSALISHYEDTLDSCRLTLAETPFPESMMERSLQVCVRWARRQLGRKLDPIVLDNAISEIRDTQKFAASTPDLREPVPGSAVHDQQRALAILTTSTSTQTTPTSDDLFTQPSLPTEVVLTAQEDLISFSTAISSAADQSSDAAPSSLQISDSQATAKPSSETQHNSTTPTPSHDVDLDSSPTNPVTVSSCHRPRKRDFTQLDLCGSVAEHPPRQRSRSLSTPRSAQIRSFAPTKCRVVIGDTNVAELDLITEADILALPYGRLSWYRSLLRSLSDKSPSVTHFVVVLSHLDRTNSPTTNLGAIRNVTGLARNLFPNARLAVVLDGLCECDSRPSVVTLNNTLRNTPPNGCTIIEAPTDFSCFSGKWSVPTATAYSSAIDSFLG